MPSLLSHNLRGLIAQAVRTTVFFQFIRIGVHAPDSQFRGKPFQLVPFLKVHDQSPFGFVSLLALIYILAFGLSSIILKDFQEF